MMRSRLAAAGFLLAMFALGVVVGGVGVSAAEHRRYDPGEHRGGRNGYLDLLTTALELSPAQRESVEVILDRHGPVLDSLWEGVRPRFDSVRSVIRGEIRAQLSPEQQRKYTEMLERRNRQYQEKKKDARR